MGPRRIRLTRKLALILNGIDVSGLNVGDVMELPASAAEMMIAERWAEPVDEPSLARVALTDQPGSRLTN